MADHCPRDAFGFCWIALWQPEECGSVSDERGSPVRCPETREEADGRMEAARLHRIEEIRRLSRAPQQEATDA